MVHATTLAYPKDHVVALSLLDIRYVIIMSFF